MLQTENNGVSMTRKLLLKLLLLKKTKNLLLQHLSMCKMQNKILNINYLIRYYPFPRLAS